MKNLAQRLLLIAVVLLSLASFAPPASAQDLFELCNQTPEATVCRERNRDPDGQLILGPDSIFVRAAEIIAYAVGIAAVIMLIVGGFQYVLSTGDANKISSARSTIIYAIVGLLVAIVAQGIIQFVLMRI